MNGTTTTYSYNDANELTAAGSTTFTHDANGNLTGSSADLSLSYDAKNRTSSVTPAGGTLLNPSRHSPEVRESQFSTPFDDPFGGGEDLAAS